MLNIINQGKADQNYYEIPHLLGWLLLKKKKKKKTRDNNIGKDVKKREPYTLLVGA